MLTTPVVRVLSSAGHTVHYATKHSFEPVLRANPYIAKIHYLKSSLPQLLLELKHEGFDFIVDLHNNLRTRILKMALNIPSASFNKLNIEKYKLIRFKDFDAMPPIHIVDRYLQTLAYWGLQAGDGKGLEFYISDTDKPSPEILRRLPGSYTVLVLGGQHITKQLPSNKLAELLQNIKGEVVLLGAEKDAIIAKEAVSVLTSAVTGKVINLCGLLSLRESCWVLNGSTEVFANDTGLMHIAASFSKKVTAIWGNTVPELGMYPYKTPFRNFEVKGLSCRPCSKIGFDKCPEGHFKCMNNQDFSSENLNRAFS